MSIFKNPFSKEKSNEQLTPDLLTPEISQIPENEIQKGVDLQKEKAKEKVEKQAQKKLQSVEVDKPAQVSAQIAAQTQTKPDGFQKSINLQKIERAMQENLEEVFFNMDEAHRRMFKEEGERTARQIETVVRIGKSAAVKILELLKRWLCLIPGVNKFFLEQEAKIKTDKILKITGLEDKN
ncbi:MAG: hypothetical protein ABIJ91_04360 [Candidatus Kuenenbacteria bacterium]